jgi:hypothetical protein
MVVHPSTAGDVVTLHFQGSQQLQVLLPMPTGDAKWSSSYAGDGLSKGAEAGDPVTGLYASMWTAEPPAVGPEAFGLLVFRQVSPTNAPVPEPSTVYVHVLA